MGAEFLLPEVDLPENESQRVLLVLMPWAPPRFPGLGPTLLRTILNRDGLPCDICYGNLVFARVAAGDAIAESELEKLPVAELVFTPFYFDVPSERVVEQIHRHVLTTGPDESVHTVDRYRRIVSMAGKYIDELFRRIDWQKYDVVGFSVMMEQTVPSLALAKRIKQRYPKIRIIFGGPNCSFPMGDEIITRFPEVDYIVEGEADGCISPLVREIRQSPHGPFTIGGIRYRDADGTIKYSGPSKPFDRLDSLPVPDYSSYFEQLSDLQLSWFEPVLQFECARGCWWGEKHHCTFCSLEDELMSFRAKSPDRVLEEILTLSATYKNTEFYCTDSILNRQFLKTLMPALGKLREEQNYDFTFFFETKSNLKRSDVQMLRWSGVSYIQPGIETFSDHILALMDKGSTGARQLQCLKILAECNIDVYWNFIIRNPNETVEDYEQMIEMVPFMHHLPPMHKDGFVKLQFLRHSPYFLHPELHGITNVEPIPYYYDVFPRADIDLSRLVFYFTFRHADHDDPLLQAVHQKLAEAVKEWKRCYVADSLIQVRGEGYIEIYDKRTAATGDRKDSRKYERILLEGCWAEVFLKCDHVCGEDEVYRAFRSRITEDELKVFLNEMISRKLIYRSPSRQLIATPLWIEARNVSADSFRPEVPMKGPHSDTELVAISSLGDRPDQSPAVLLRSS